jgi:uncharacterized protein
MQIQLETPELHAVQAYTDEMLTVNGIDYRGSLILSREEIIPNIELKSIDAIDEKFIDLLIKNKPKIIIIGHKETGKFLSLDIVALLAKQQIGIECMSLDAACRTFNLLLGEGREVIAGLLF